MIRTKVQTANISKLTFKVFEMPLNRCFFLFLSFTIAVQVLPASAQQAVAIDTISVGNRLAGQSGPEAKLDEIDLIIQQIQQSSDADLELYFDLSALRLDLLVDLDRIEEAAQAAMQLAQIAITQHRVLNRSPIPFLRRAAKLFETLGDKRRVRRVLQTELDYRQEGGHSGNRIALLRQDIVRLNNLNGPTDSSDQPADQGIFSQDQLENGTRKTGQKGYHSVDVFYATDRLRTGEDEPSDFYGYGRGELEYGVVSVTVPEIHVPGAIETPSIWKLEFGPNPAKHIMVQKVEPEEPDAYFARMQAKMTSLDRKEVLVFIHGFNTSFDAAAKRAAQLAYDMDYPGIPVLFSWPSAGRTFMYVSDTAVVRLSGRRLYTFLQEMRVRSGAEVIHVVAHSMGNRALTDALELLAARYSAERNREPMFGQIFFAAPDVDAGLFKEMLNSIRPLAQRMTLYTSKEDRALVASRKLHGDNPRAGQAGAGLLTGMDFDTIDMSALGEDMLAHSYFANDSSALADIMSLIWLNARPEQRCGLEEETNNDKTTFWSYTKGSCPDTDLISVIKLLWQQRHFSPDQVTKLLQTHLEDPERLLVLRKTIERLLAEERP